MNHEPEHFWWVRLVTDFEEHYGPFRTEAQARRCASKFKCETEVLQDEVLDGSYLEFTGGEVKPASRYIVMRSGRVLPFSAENLYEWPRREYGL